MDSQYLDGPGTGATIKGILRDTDLLSLDPPSGTGANVGQTLNLQAFS